MHPCFSNMSEYQLETGLRTALMTTGLDQSYHACHAGYLSVKYTLSYRIVKIQTSKPMNIDPNSSYCL